MEEFWQMFHGLEPVNMLIDRVTHGIKMDTSPLENISLAILSDL